MRPRKKDRHLPKCVYHKHGAYWLVKQGKWIRLGTELPEDLKTGHRSPIAILIDTAMQTIKPAVSKSTWGNYVTAGNKLKHAFAEFTPQQITAADVWDFRDGNADTPNMTNRCLSLMKQVMNYAVRRRMVVNNPVIGVDAHDEAQRDREIKPAEFRAIYEKAGARLQCIMDLWYLTGQRVMDVMRIHRSQLLDDGIEFKQQKTGKKLLVRWTPELKAAVERAKGLSTVPTLTLFHGRFRRPLDYQSVHLQWVVACEAAGVANAQMRDLRAMSATEAEEQGINATSLLGHSSAAMTKRYLRRKKVAKVDGPTMKRV